MAPALIAVVSAAAAGATMLRARPGVPLPRLPDARRSAVLAPRMSTEPGAEATSPMVASLLLESKVSTPARDGALIGDDAALFSLEAQSPVRWGTFAAAVGAVLTALYVLWIRGDTGYSDDFVHALEVVGRGNSLAVNLLLGTIFPVVHSGLASLRPSAERVVGPRAWRVVFALASLPLAYTWIMYFISHRYDGGELWDLHAVPGVHAAVWGLAFVSFFFLYPSTFNLLEVAAVDAPKLHLWETGVIRLTRHPQLTGQVLWSAAHLAWVGTPFTAETMALLVAHHLFAAWNGDRRLRAKHGGAFDYVCARTSVVPFAAILDGRQSLPGDYWKEWARLPYAVILAGVLGAYWAHPLMQGAAALVQNAGYEPGGLLGGGA